MLQVEFVDSAHQLKITKPQTGRKATVVTGSRHTKDLTSALNGDLWMTGGDHFLLLCPVKLRRNLHQSSGIPQIRAAAHHEPQPVRDMCFAKAAGRKN